MKRLPGLLAALVLLAGCADLILGPSPNTTSGPSATATTTTTTAPPTTLLSTTTTTIPTGPPVAWVAPSGVTLAVSDIGLGVVELLTPCGNPVAMSAGSPIYDVEVVIDPGHGGPIDTGAVASTGLAEKDLNLAVSKSVQEILSERGITSLLTRTADYAIPIRTRSAFSDLTGAKALVSIHHNAPEAPASDIPGAEIFVQDGTSESARLGGLLYDATMAALSRFDVDWDRAPDAGVMTVLNSNGEDAYGMVRLPDAPSALVELGYIANPAEAELYANPAYVPAAAGAVADAVETFLTSEDTGAPLVEGRDFNPSPGVGGDQCVEPELEESLYPDVVGAEVSADGDTYEFTVTLSSPYDAPERYADAWRVIGDDGVVYGVRELEHHHGAEQPFTRSLEDVDIPASVDVVTIEGRDLVYGWGGGTQVLVLP